MSGSLSSGSLQLRPNVGQPSSSGGVGVSAALTAPASRRAAVSSPRPTTPRCPPGEGTSVHRSGCGRDETGGHVGVLGDARVGIARQAQVKALTLKVTDIIGSSANERLQGGAASTRAEN